MRARRPRVPSASLVLFIALACGAPRRALTEEETDTVQRARAFFEEGRAHFRLGDFEAAARAFSDGYAVVPRSQFLLNMGLCYRNLKQLDRAEDAFRRFLTSAAPDDPYLGQARELLDEVVRQRAAPQPAAPLATHTAAQAAPPAPAMASPAPPDRRRRTLRTLAWALPLGALVLTGAVVGIVLGVRAAGPACSDERFGCFDLR